MTSKFGFETPEDGKKRVLLEHEDFVKQLNQFLPDVLSDFLRTAFLQDRTIAEYVASGRKVNFSPKPDYPQFHRGAITKWDGDMSRLFFGGKLTSEEGVEVSHTLSVGVSDHYLVSKTNLDILESVLKDEVEKLNIRCYVSVKEFYPA